MQKELLEKSEKENRELQADLAKAQETNKRQQQHIKDMKEQVSVLFVQLYVMFEKKSSEIQETELVQVKDKELAEVQQQFEVMVTNSCMEEKC